MMQRDRRSRNWNTSEEKEEQKLTNRSRRSFRLHANHLSRSDQTIREENRIPSLLEGTDTNPRLTRSAVLNHHSPSPAIVSATG